MHWWSCRDCPLLTGQIWQLVKHTKCYALMILPGLSSAHWTDMTTSQTQQMLCTDDPAVIVLSITGQIWQLVKHNKCYALMILLWLSSAHWTDMTTSQTQQMLCTDDPAGIVLSITGQIWQLVKHNKRYALMILPGLSSASLDRYDN